MSKPVFEEIFDVTHSGRRNRKSFVLFLLAQLVVTFIATVAIVLAVNHYDIGDFGKGIIGLFLLVSALLMVVASAAASVQRLRDIGYSGWFFLLTFVPIVSTLLMISLILLPGNKGKNQFGSDPRE